MRFLDVPANASREVIAARWREYVTYIESVRGKLPDEAAGFALAEWHHDFSDRRCPHDAWVESVVVAELARGERQEMRSLEIRVVLLGSYHDGRIHLTYPGVTRYDLRQPSGADGRAHGDWLVDEVDVAPTSTPEQRRVVHAIAFAGGAHWTIEAANILYQWVPSTHA